MRSPPIVVTYRGEAQAVYDAGGPPWRDGKDVAVAYNGALIPYFDFVIQTRLCESEPAIEIARFILAHRARRIAYVSKSLRLSRQYAKAIGHDPSHVRSIVSHYLRVLDEN